MELEKILLEWELDRVVRKVGQMEVVEDKINQITQLILGEGGKELKDDITL